MFPSTYNSLNILSLYQLSNSISMKNSINPHQTNDYGAFLTLVQEHSIFHVYTISLLLCIHSLMKFKMRIKYLIFYQCFTNHRSGKRSSLSHHSNKTTICLVSMLPLIYPKI
jgi:hypothetical protein